MTDREKTEDPIDPEDETEQSATSAVPYDDDIETVAATYRGKKLDFPDVPFRRRPRMAMPLGPEK